MMKNITLGMKHIMLTFTLAMFAVAASAVNVTYSLTTHVDGRTMTASANLNAGADLLTSMPQALWRAYCTYSFTNEAGEEITSVPANGGTVYVDYEFDPPFILSEDNGEPVWHYLKHQPGVNPARFFYYSEYHGKYYQQYGNDDVFWQKQNLTTGNQTLKTKENAQWAFYGDAYCFNLKFNDKNNIESNDFLTCKITSRTFFGRVTYTYKLVTGAKMMPGWQLYVNDAINGGFSLGLPDDTHINQLIWLYDYADAGDIKNLSSESDCGRSSQNHITNTDSQGQGWDECLCYAFLATPATDSSSSLDPWHVTYKVLQADGEWYQDIVKTKKSSDLTPAFPTEYEQQEGYIYDYFYKDADFTEKCEEGYTMPASGNTVLYIKEVATVADRWTTICLPYGIDDVAEYFGEGAVIVNKLTGVEVDGAKYKLLFDEVGAIESGVPYMFKAKCVRSDQYETLYPTDAYKDAEAKSVSVDYPATSATVWMHGTFEGTTLTYDANKTQFFMGYKINDKEAEGYLDEQPNFYRISTTRDVEIKPFRCWFEITDMEGAGVKSLVWNLDEGATAIDYVMTEKGLQQATSIYSLDGRQLGNFDTLKKGIYIINGRKVVK